MKYSSFSLFHNDKNSYSLLKAILYSIEFFVNLIQIADRIWSSREMTQKHIPKVKTFEIVTQI